MTRTVLLVLAAVVVGCDDRSSGAAPRDVGPPSLLAQETASRIDTVRQRLNAEIALGRRSAIVDAAAQVGPAVVSVNVIRRVRRVVRPSVFDFFGMPRAYEREVAGVGSGFVVSADGLVITNQHVTDGAAQIVVTTPRGEDYPAELLGEDPLTDIAVLKIDATDLPVVTLGSSRDLAIGEWVVAFGNPFAYLLGNTEPTVTAGVVSAVGRNLLPSEDQPGIYVGMIQTDAAINPGNSGGPLANAAGEVVGVNSSIFSQSGGSVGIGFAIPIERALRVAEELRRFGTVRRAWVGVDVAGQDELRAWKTAGGLRVVQVVPDSPADRAGIRAGDVLAAAGDQPMRTFLDWEAAKLDVGPGDSLVVIARRGDRERELRLTVESLPSTRADRVSVLDIDLISITPSIRQERGLERDVGALIVEIGATTARQTGLRQSDVILQINRQPVRSAEDVREIFTQAAGRAAVRVYVDRGGRIYYTDFFVR